MTFVTALKTHPNMYIDNTNMHINNYKYYYCFSFFALTLHFIADFPPPWNYFKTACTLPIVGAGILLASVGILF